MLWSWVDVQWPPLLIAAALTPGLSWLLAIKPTAGFALWAAYPNRKAVIGGLLMSTLLSLIFVPAVFVLIDRLERKITPFFSRFSSTHEDKAKPREHPAE